MPANPPKDAIVIVLDIGKSVSTLQYTEGKTFFELARDCVSWIIQRKIISQSVDVVSLLLIGSDECDQRIGTNEYQNILTKFDFQLASWDLLKFIETEVRTTNNESDWFGALIVSVELLRQYEEYNNVQNKKIVVFSDFSDPALDDISIVTESMEQLNIEVTIIGPDHLAFLTVSEDEEEPEKKKFKKSRERQEGERVVYNLWKRLPDNVIICTFESALKQLCSYAPKIKRVSYWNCILDIGELKINISMTKKTDPKPAKKFTTRCAKPAEQETGEGTSKDGNDSSQFSDSVPAVRDTVMHYKHETGDGKEFSEVEVRPEDTVKGFRYGKTIVPFTEEDKSALEYQCGPKCFSVLGFTSISSVPYYFLSGDCAYVVLPRPKDKNAEVALSALIQGMKKTDCLAVVRRVYSDNRGLSLGILYPIVEEIVCDDPPEVSYKEYLLFVELAFEEDVKSVDFPSLERFAKEITEKQYEAVDNLIDGMNLMKADKGLRGEPCEAIDLPFLHDFKEQFFHYCVIQRGLYPDKPLPKSLPPYIKNFTKAPKTIEEKCKSLIKDIKAVFKIEMTKPKPEKTTSKDSKRSHSSNNSKDESTEERKQPRDSNEHFSERDIEKEKNPILGAWMRLFGKRFPTEEDLDCFFSKTAEDKAFDPLHTEKYFLQVLTDIRRMYLRVIPNEFNSWLVRFKTYTKDKGGLEGELWNVIVRENLGLISSKENRDSNVTEEEAEEFLCDDTKHASSLAGEEGASGRDANARATTSSVSFNDLEEEQMDLDSFF